MTNRVFGWSGKGTLRELADKVSKSLAEERPISTLDSGSPSDANLSWEPRFSESAPHTIRNGSREAELDMLLGWIDGRAEVAEVMILDEANVFIHGLRTSAESQETALDYHLGMRQLGELFATSTRSSSVSFENGETLQLHISGTFAIAIVAKELVSDAIVEVALSKVSRIMEPPAKLDEELMTSDNKSESPSHLPLEEKAEDAILHAADKVAGAHINGVQLDSAGDRMQKDEWSDRDDNEIDGVELFGEDSETGKEEISAADNARDIAVIMTLRPGATMPTAPNIEQVMEHSDLDQPIRGDRLARMELVARSLNKRAKTEKPDSIQNDKSAGVWKSDELAMPVEVVKIDFGGGESS